MRKKEITTNNPYGVEYPEAVTADGVLVSAIDIDNESDNWKNIRFYFPGCEGDEEEEMKFVRRKHKNGITPFFRHKQGYIGDRNEPDRYLHNYAELKLKQRFDESVSSGIFEVYFYEIRRCAKEKSCTLKSQSNCQSGTPFLRSLNLREYYDTCTPEKGVDKYIADLLLTNSKNSNIKPLFLEIFVTHKCTEEKINSGNPIIEIKIDKKEDADKAIIENAGEIVDKYLFMKSPNEQPLPPIVFYGFKRESEISNSNYVNYLSFTLIEDKNIYLRDCREIICKDICDEIPPKGVLNLLVPKDEIKKIDFYEVGMAVAHNKGMKLCDCSLCTRYKIPHKNGKDIDPQSCRLSNVIYSYYDNNGVKRQISNPYIFQMPYRCNNFDKSKKAAQCPNFKPDDQRLKKLANYIHGKNHILRFDPSLIQTLKNAISNVYEPERKLLTAQECFKCPIYRPRCGHCLGEETKDGRQYVICDFQRLI